MNERIIKNIMSAMKKDGILEDIVVDVLKTGYFDVECGQLKESLLNVIEYYSIPSEFEQWREENGQQDT